MRQRQNMKQLKSLRWVAVALACAVATPALAERILDGDPVHGALLYKKNCASCHGVAGAGGKAAKLNTGAMINALDEKALIEMLTGDGPNGLHDGLKDGLALLDAWDVIGYLRSRVVMLGELFPKANRYIVKEYSVDKNARDRFKRSTGKAMREADGKAMVFTLFTKGQASPLVLVPQDPRLLDGLDRKDKVGYVVFVPFVDAKGKTLELALALEPKQFRLAGLRAMNSQGEEDKDLNKLLSRFIGKGDRRLSGKPKAKLSAGGGGRKIKNLELGVTKAYLMAAELATAYEVEERERSWADDDIELADPSEKGDDDFSIK